MTEERNELKNCPACGAKAYFCQDNTCTLVGTPSKSSGDVVQTWAVICGKRCGMGTEFLSTQEKAMGAWNRRPPNLPLTYEQLAGLDSVDAVWKVDADWSPPLIEVMQAKDIQHSNRSQQELNEIYALRVYLFAARPTPADIDAARTAV
jgi:hypothetical protein